MKQHLSRIAILIGCLCAPQHAHAQSITTIQPLSFGTFVVADYDTISEVTVNPATGSFTYSSTTYGITDPQRGEYRVTGATPNTPFTVSAGPASNILGGPGSKTLEMDNLTISPSTHTTDGSGEATFYIGGRLRSDGSGDTYSNGTYNDSYNITLTF